mmetsp:Transcript_17116/g.39923  ORF Transcript_17116/g.39923 Transcript_17116/m.39923 type:complete len:142 (-) Transcript_17116:98-523(-)|eukprot:CAMPEP_0178404134 /NCGR_PEP_ID=MMETSP0689_2-20121128/17724_1 /TAXON_ID=160604 /ORGANISM="Amphidinium massartii, Strain CS-259" /LENGTH=141 /DNA_ID=CAMNT_0020025103 /DNA_START=83 /DNA_END=508 /DNA_ORIENTATION=+
MAQKVLTELLGEDLVGKDGALKLADVVAGKKRICLYFSAHWCPPCRGFTPELANAYTKYAGGDIEVIFISSDRSEDAFKDYFGSMPWKALPYEKRDKKDAAAHKFDVKGIPMLVVLDADGNVVKENARGDVHTTGGLECLL